jgi:transposase
MPRVSKAEEIKLRRIAVLEHVAKGLSQSEIAAKLNYHKSTISNDIRYLKERSKEEFKQYVEQELPFEHKIAVQGLKYVKKQAVSIAENTRDERIKLHALSLFKGVNSDLWELHTSAEVLEKSLKYVQARKQELKDLEFHYLQHQQHLENGSELITTIAGSSEDKNNNNNLADDPNAVF